MDGWLPEDWRYISPQSFDWIDKILNKVEGGANWPEGTRHGRAAYLAKDPEELEDPLGYRPLLVLPHVYRVWSGFRLRCIKPWITTWATPHTFSGIPEMGAENAWWLTGLRMESDQATDVDHSGSSSDIQRCFDQIVRPLLYAVLKAAGMPRQVLDAYAIYLEGLSMYSSVGEGIGVAFKRRCGIPQGCPMSMMAIALLLRPWDIALATPFVIPRMLADDLLVYTRGVNHVDLLCKALNFTHTFLADIGAVAAPKKSYNSRHAVMLRGFTAAAYAPW